MNEKKRPAIEGKALWLIEWLGKSFLLHDVMGEWFFLAISIHDFLHFDCHTSQQFDPSPLRPYSLISLFAMKLINQH